MSFSWTCPYCNILQLVTDDNLFYGTMDCFVSEGKQIEGDTRLTCETIVCASEQCKRTTIAIKVEAGNFDRTAWCWSTPNRNMTSLMRQKILPQGNAKPQPDYIPKAIRDDYTEACLIRDLSPKASATLIRRCLQGMIHDFAGITKGNLGAEVTALKKAVEERTADPAISIETVEAIDHVRSIGNIGAHMEKDVDHIIPVDPDEAQTLITLVEMLFDEWYKARHVRRERLSGIKGIFDSKRAIKEDYKKSEDASSSNDA